MKNLVFVDNDQGKGVCGHEDEELYYAKNSLKANSDLDEEVIKSIKTCYNFSDLERDEQYKLLFDNSNVIITWSMFTGTHHGSLFQLYGFLAGAGRNRIKKQIYIDLASYLIRSLEGFTNEKQAYQIAVGIESNYILTAKNGGIERIRVDLTDYFNPIYTEKIESLSTLLSL